MLDFVAGIKRIIVLSNRPFRNLEKETGRAQPILTALVTAGTEARLHLPAKLEYFDLLAPFKSCKILAQNGKNFLRIT